MTSVPKPSQAQIHHSHPAEDEQVFDTTAHGQEEFFDVPLADDPPDLGQLHLLSSTQLIATHGNPRTHSEVLEHPQTPSDQDPDYKEPEFDPGGLAGHKHPSYSGDLLQHALHDEHNSHAAHLHPVSLCKPTLHPNSPHQRNLRMDLLNGEGPIQKTSVNTRHNSSDGEVKESPSPILDSRHLIGMAAVDHVTCVSTKEQGLHNTLGWNQLKNIAKTTLGKFKTRAGPEYGELKETIPIITYSSDVVGSTYFKDLHDGKRQLREASARLHDNLADCLTEMSLKMENCWKTTRPQSKVGRQEQD